VTPAEAVPAKSRAVSRISFPSRPRRGRIAGAMLPPLTPRFPLAALAALLARSSSPARHRQLVSPARRRPLLLKCGAGLPPPPGGPPRRPRRRQLAVVPPAYETLGGDAPAARRRASRPPRRAREGDRRRPVRRGVRRPPRARPRLPLARRGGVDRRRLHPLLRHRPARPQLHLRGGRRRLRLRLRLRRRDPRPAPPQGSGQVGAPRRRADRALGRLPHLPRHPRAGLK
jgi:hypothetical protein